MADPLTLDARRAILQREVAGYTRRGFRVLAQTDTTAQLVKPKKFSLLWAIVWLILGVGVGLLIYFVWYMAKRDQTVYLQVDEHGRIKRT